MEAINNSPKSDNKVFKIFFALFSKLCKLIVEKKQYTEEMKGINKQTPEVITIKYFGIPFYLFSYKVEILL